MTTRRKTRKRYAQIKKSLQKNINYYPTLLKNYMNKTGVLGYRENG